MPVFQAIAEEVKRLYDDGRLIVEIAEQVKRTRDTVMAALEYWYKSHGQSMPDGRNRRKTLAIKNRSKNDPSDE